MNLIQAFEIGPKEIISLVGGGGKTTLMYALAKELSDKGNRVITTTTTRIFPPEISQSPLLIIDNNDESLRNKVINNIHTYKHITIANANIIPGKLKGISLSLIESLSILEDINYIIIEADGAARKPLKAPNATEPVIPENTTLLIPVIGVESIGKKLNDETVFRSEIASTLLKVPVNSIITAKLIATLITHPQGITKGCSSNSRIVPLLNKTDLLPSQEKAEELANEILNRNHPQIHRVILGQVMKPIKIKNVIIGK
jgi:probable selenium-dependent hydroxylase accessory protein YqeC